MIIEKASNKEIELLKDANFKHPENIRAMTLSLTYSKGMELILLMLGMEKFLLRTKI